MAQKIPTLNNQRLATEMTTSRDMALSMAANLASLCGCTKRTDLGYGNTSFYFSFDPVFSKRWPGGPGFGCPKIVVGPDDRVKYFASSTNVDRLDMLVDRLRQNNADLSFYDALRSKQAEAEMIDSL